MSLSVGLFGFGLFGALVSMPLLKWGRRFNDKTLVAVEKWDAWLFSLVFMGSLILLYPWSLIVVLTIVVAATWIFFTYWPNRKMSWRSKFRRVAAVGAGVILICELWLSAASAGWFPNTYATLCACVGKSRSLPALTSASKVQDANARQEAVEVLGEIGKPALPALIAVLKDQDTLDSGVHPAAASALGKIGDKSAVPALIAALKDNGLYTRLKAIEALGEIGDKSAAPALEATLKNNGSYALSEAATEALKKIETLHTGGSI